MVDEDEQKAWSHRLSADRREILDQADRYARAELYPLAERMDAEEWWPADIMRRLGEAGYLGITTPSQLGGLASDVFTAGLIAQAFARWNPALALSRTEARTVGKEWVSEGESRSAPQP